MAKRGTFIIPTIPYNDYNDKIIEVLSILNNNIANLNETMLDILSDLSVIKRNLDTK